MSRPKFDFSKLPVAEKAKVEQRFQDLEQNPGEGEDWEIVQARLRSMFFAKA